MKQNPTVDHHDVAVEVPNGGLVDLDLLEAVCLEKLDIKRETDLLDPGYVVFKKPDTGYLAKANIRSQDILPNPRCHQLRNMSIYRSAKLARRVAS